MRKKSMALLLSAALIFSMNTGVFAGENAADETVTEEYDQTEDEWTSSYNASNLTSSVDRMIQSVNGTTLSVRIDNPIVKYTGKKVTADRLEVYIYDSESKYYIPVKKIKLTGTNKKANATGAITYKLRNMYNWKYMIMLNTQGGSNQDANSVEKISVKETKQLYKVIKAKFKMIKNQEFKAYVKPHYIYQSVSTACIKTLKKNKLLSENDLKVDGHSIEDSVVVKKKNGVIRSIQLPIVTRRYYTFKYQGLTYMSRACKLKITLKKLKPAIDYTVSGDVINFTDSASFSGKGGFAEK